MRPRLAPPAAPAPRRNLAASEPRIAPNGLTSTGLVLPRITAPAAYIIEAGQGQRLKETAHWLVNSGVLQSLHLRPKAKTLVEVFTGQKPDTFALQPSDLVHAIEKSLAAYLTPFCPHDLYRIHVTENADHHYSDYGYGGSMHYRRERHVDRNATVSTIELHLTGEARITVIGPKLKRLERAVPQLGQTVLHTLDECLHVSCRGMTPRSGIGWAARAYWMGENDESLRMEEDIASYDGDDPNKPTPETWEGFRKRDYDRAIPGWAGTGKIEPLTQQEFLNLAPHVPKWARQIHETTALLQALTKPRGWFTLNDAHLFESVLYEITPFLLRWSDQDPLPQIWDDVMNDHFNAGESDMELAGLWAWHDEPSLRQALDRLRRYLIITRLCTDLICLLD